MTLAGRPPVGLGVTSGGNFYGNTQITFTDVLGDKQISFYAQSVSQYRTTAFTYVNIERRLQYALQGFSQDMFYYGQDAARRSTTRRSRRTSTAIWPRRCRASAAARRSRSIPFNRYTRVGAVRRLHAHVRAVHEPGAAGARRAVPGRPVRPARLPQRPHDAARRLVRPGDDGLPRVRSGRRQHVQGLATTARRRFSDSWLSRQTSTSTPATTRGSAPNGVLALRFKGFKSWGRNPDFIYFGGNSEMRGYEYLEFIGQKAFFANAELRFPLIEAMLTPLGVLGGLRGVFFANIGGAGFNSQPFTFMTQQAPSSYTPLLGYQIVDIFGNVVAGLRPAASSSSGFRLVDGRASYGIGLESFLLGFPMHFDWSWKTLFNRDWEDVLFRSARCQRDSSGCTPAATVPQGEVRVLDRVRLLTMSSSEVATRGLRRVG